ncbi:hypothetical protein D3C87_1516620 [compost metagenome]
MALRDTGLDSAWADGQPACKASRTCDCSSSSLRLLIQMIGGMLFSRPASTSRRRSLGRRVPSPSPITMSLISTS